MVHTSSSNAIKLALEQQWEEAIKVNKALLEQNSSDIDALKRIAYAYLQVGKITKAKTYYKSVLKIDKNNPIAIKALKRVDGLKSSRKTNCGASTSIPEMFLEEPGRTKIISLINLAPNKALCNVAVGQKVQLLPKKRSIEIRDNEKIYLGALPDDISHRLSRLMAGGNVYEACVKQVEKNRLLLFIREVRRGAKYKKIPSFVNNIQATYIPFVRNNLIKKEVPDVATLEESDEA